MKFRTHNTDPSPDFYLVCGVYFHGKVEEAIGYDCVEISKDDSAPFKLLVNDGKGIEGMKVEVEGYDGETVLYAWKSNMGVPLIANPPFESLWFRGLIVDINDAESVKHAKKCFKDKIQECL